MDAVPPNDGGQPRRPLGRPPKQKYHANLFAVPDGFHIPNFQLIPGTVDQYGCGPLHNISEFLQFVKHNMMELAQVLDLMQSVIALVDGCDDILMNQNVDCIRFCREDWNQCVSSISIDYIVFNKITIKELMKCTYPKTINLFNNKYVDVTDLESMIIDDHWPRKPSIPIGFTFPTDLTPMELERNSNAIPVCKNVLVNGLADCLVHVYQTNKVIVNTLRGYEMMALKDFLKNYGQIQLRYFTSATTPLVNLIKHANLLVFKVETGFPVNNKLNIQWDVQLDELGEVIQVTGN
jgi:hypothetical protein